MTARLSYRLRAARAGAFLGILATFGVVVLLPIGLDRLVGLHIAKAWGLGDLAAPLCLIGALPGGWLAMSMARKNATPSPRWRPHE